MSAKTGALQCLQQAIAQIQHAVGTRTWFCIHELRGDDQQQHQTLNLRHHLGLSSTQYDVLLHEVGYNIGKKGMRHKYLELYWARSNYLSSWVVQMMALFQTLSSK